MEPVLLTKRSWEGPRGGTETTSVWAEMTAAGDLQISAVDVGPTVEHVWSDDDYEYGITIKAADLPKILPLILADAFNGAKGMSVEGIRAICEKAGVDPGFWTWS